MLSVISLAVITFAAKRRRRNTGFLITASVLTVSDLLCAFLVGVNNAREAGAVLLPYYIAHAWLLFGVLVMVIYIDRFRKFIVPMVMAAGVSAYQTYLVISQYMGARVFSFQKRMYFRKAWWVAVDSKNVGLFDSYRSYRIFGYITLAIILAVLVLCIRYSHRIFRSRYYVMGILMLVYSGAESMTISFQLPVWIPGLAYNLITVIGLYYTTIYADTVLREWSLDSFANDMSDGLILYDRHDDLIHINDMVKDTLDEDLLEAFNDRTRLEAWICDVDRTDDSGTVRYTNGERDYYFKVNVQELGGHGVQIGTLYILHDSTESVTRISAMQRANEKLERAARMKSDFLANMSHEIRTPMNAVIGMAEIALREKDPAQIADYLRQIQSSGKNLLNIINDILDYSKIESGKMEIIEDELIPFAELDDIANVLATRIGDKPLEFFILITSNLPHKLYGDAMRIRQILINLANNAIKFTPSGHVIIRVTCEPIDQDHIEAAFHVIDTGIGIKEEDLGKLFVSFQQVDSRRNRSAEGTGLGLAISQKLVEAMGGTIGVESEYGTGSDFWFKLPLRVIDAESDLAVTDAEHKHAFAIAQNPNVISAFMEEMDNLGVTGAELASISDYVPTGERDYLFFDSPSYNEDMHSYLSEHPDITGVIFGGFADDFESDLPNLHVLSRPGTTIRMVRILNGQYDETGMSGESQLFRIDYTAPEARILVVDDNAINLTIAEGLLEPLHVQLDKADGGQRAIDMAAAKDYDVILMDHMMPGIDGVDATRAIREACGSNDKPVIIALSANAIEEARKLFAEVGMNDFVAKPIDVKDLTLKLKKWLPEDKIVPVDEGSVGAASQPADTVRIQSAHLDTKAAVAALGSASLYDKIAGEYYRSGAEKLSGIRTAYDTEDWKDYTIRVHALKSSSRQIGALALGDMAENLENAGKAGDIDTIRAHTDETLETFGALLDELSVYYGEDENDGADKPEITADVLLSLLDELSEACDELDMDKMESVSLRLKEYNYSNQLREHIDALHTAIGDIDTEACADIAEKIRDIAATQI